MNNIKSFTVTVNAPEIRSYDLRAADGSRRLIAPAIVNQKVTIVIDLDKLAASMGPRAIRSKSGRCIEASGAVIVKR